MNIATAILVGGAMGGVCAGVFFAGNSAEAAPTQAPLVFLSTASFAFPTNPVVFSVRSGPSHSPALFAEVRNFLPLSAKAQARLLSQSPLATGIYKTEPFRCLVLVPGPHLDDRALAPAGAADPKMPIVKPDLRLVPWPKK